MLRRVGHGKTQFRAKIKRVDNHFRLSKLAWKASLLNQTEGQTWWLVAASTAKIARVDTPQFTALVRLARRLTKKKGQLQVYTHAGGPTTAKSLGTRMGNGKGKTVNHRRWWSPGFKVMRIACRQRPSWLRLINSRCGTSLDFRLGTY
jgi:ribosomal protein L16/L10AE